jgi:hypothetical protein
LGLFSNFFFCKKTKEEMASSKESKESKVKINELIKLGQNKGLKFHKELKECGNPRVLDQKGALVAWCDDKGVAKFHSHCAALALIVKPGALGNHDHLVKWAWQSWPAAEATNQWTPDHVIIEQFGENTKSMQLIRQVLINRSNPTQDFVSLAEPGFKVTSIDKLMLALLGVNDTWLSVFCTEKSYQMLWSVVLDIKPVASEISLSQNIGNKDFIEPDHDHDRSDKRCTKCQICQQILITANHKCCGACRKVYYCSKECQKKDCSFVTTIMCDIKSKPKCYDPFWADDRSDPWFPADYNYNYDALQDGDEEYRIALYVLHL